MAPDIPTSSKLAREAAPGTACALKATTTTATTTSAIPLAAYVHVGSVVVTLDTRVAHALFRNYVTGYVGGDEHGPVEHLQLTLQSLWRIELWVVLNMRHQWGNKREIKHLVGGDSAAEDCLGRRGWGSK